MNLKTKEDFNKFVTEFYADGNNKKPFAFGIGLPIVDSNGNLIAVKWLELNINSNFDTAAVLLVRSIGIKASEIVQDFFSPFLLDEEIHANIEALKFIGNKKPILKFYFSESELTEEPPLDILDVHFRHCLMSRRFYKPHSLDLEGAFGILPNLVWTSSYAYTVEEYNEKWYELQASGDFPIGGVDKFPSMFWANPVPIGIRVPNPITIRNGAYLAAGTTVMHYAFVNFNAGTLGSAMVEGRIAAGVVIGKGTDVGAGAGFLGTLSGGNERVLSVGRGCLIGAMSEVGIILGHGNQVAAGVTILANSKVYDLRNPNFLVWKEGINFDNCDNTLFLFNTKEGRLEARNVKNPVVLNEELHKN